MAYGPLLEKNFQGLTGNLCLTGVTTPPAPPSGKTILYAQDIGDRILPCFKDSSNYSNNLQTCVGRSKVAWASALGNGSVVSAFAISVPTNTGTATTRNVANTNLLSSCRRVGYVSAASNPSSCGVRAIVAQYLRGTAQDMGGFMMVWRFAVTDAVNLGTAPTMFCGMTSSVNNLTTIDNTLTDVVGICQLSGSTNMQVIHNDGSGTATVVDLGSSFPCNVSNLYEVTFACSPNSSTIGYQIKILGTSTEANGTLSDNLPTNNVLLAPQLVRRNNTASAVAVDFSSLYIETYV
jgi:hypothetical protein